MTNDSDLASINHSFYKAFEDNFRGSRELISVRLEFYLPYIRALLNSQTFPECVAVDLGCGRCEWLDLLRQEGFSTIGIDTNIEMTSSHSTGHKVINGDAVSMLSSMDSGSASVISAFHLVEHIPFERTSELLVEALRVLQAGGLLILETPNIDNLCVQAKFHADPTHLNPLPCELLSFACEYYGYHRWVTLQPLDDQDLLYRQRRPQLQDILFALSGDLGLVAQKAPDTSRTADCLGKLFEPPLRLSSQQILNEIEQQYCSQTVYYIVKLERLFRRIKVAIGLVLSGRKK